MADVAIENHFIPKGVAHYSIPHCARTQQVVFLLAPKFSMAAFSAAVETLRIANQLTGQPLYQWSIISEDGGAVYASNGVSVGVDGPMEVTEREAFIFVCSGVEPQKMASANSANWIREQWRRGQTVGGLCTGAYTLAKAGILEGRTFTLHWENMEPFREIYPHLDPVSQLYAIDNRIMTAAGGASATDLFVRLIKDVHGQTLASQVLNMCILPFHREASDRQIASNAAQIGARNHKLTEIITYFENNIEDPIGLDTLSRRLQISRRQMERLFKRYLGQTPKQFLSDMRLQRGRALLAETNCSVAEVSAACGFQSATHFSKRYREKFGHSPHRFSV